MFLLQPHYIGFEIGKSSLRIVQIRKTRKGWEPLLLKEMGADLTVNPLYKKIKESFSISALDARDVLVRPCEIPLTKPKDIFAALDFHVEPLLPYPIDKAIIQAQINEKLASSTSLTVSAVRKDHLALHLEYLKKYRIEPDAVISKAHALAALSLILPQTSAPLLLVHEADEEITAVLVEKGSILAVRAIDNKGDLTVEIQKTILSLSSSHKTKPFDTIYFFGKSQVLKTALLTASDKNVLPPSSASLLLTQEELIQFSLSIGCALAHSAPQFRQREFEHPHRFRLLKKPLTLFFSLSILLTGALFACGEVSLNAKKRATEEAYLSLMKEERKSTGEIPVPQTPREYLSSLVRLEKDVRNRPDTFPLLPQVPRVKELLGWLSSLPEGRGVSIDSFNYQMIKYPDFPQKQERYKVRVDLELSASNPDHARSFQTALKNPNLFVDAQEEVQWMASKGKFKASFFLKDKTKYN